MLWRGTGTSLFRGPVHPRIVQDDIQNPGETSRAKRHRELEEGFNGLVDRRDERIRPLKDLADAYFEEEVLGPLEADLRDAVVAASAAPDLEIAAAAGIGPAEGLAAVASVVVGQRG